MNLTSRRRKLASIPLIRGQRTSWQFCISKEKILCIKNLNFHKYYLLSRIRTELSSWSCSQAVSKLVWHIPLLCVQWKTPDDGQRNCPKHVEFYCKNLSRCTVTWKSNIVINRCAEKRRPTNVKNLPLRWSTHHGGVWSFGNHNMSVVAHLRPPYSKEEVPNLYANCLDEKVCRNKASCYSLKFSFHPTFTASACANLSTVLS